MVEKGPLEKLSDKEFEELNKLLWKAFNHEFTLFSKLYDLLIKDENNEESYITNFIIEKDNPSSQLLNEIRNRIAYVIECIFILKHGL